MSVIIGIVLFCVGFTLGIGLISILNVSKISYLEDENYKEHVNNITLQNQIKEIKKKKVELNFQDIDKALLNDCLDKAETHMANIIGVTTSERVLAECNLMQEEFKFLRKENK